MAEIISFCKGTGYLDTTIHNRMVIKRSYRKTPYMPIQKQWMAILPFTPQNFKLIINEYCNWRETRKNIRFNVVQQWIYIYKS
jgi:hypothetical protein